MSISVYASAMEGRTESETKDPTLNLDDLSIYSKPQQQSSEATVPEVGHLEQSVAAVRVLVEPCATWCHGTYEQIEPRVRSVLQLGSDTYDYLKSPPPDFYARAGVIGFTGVLGLFLARGSRIKRALYPAGLMTVTASLYYPEKAAAVTRSTRDSVYDWAVQSYASLEKMFKGQSKK